MKHKQAFSLIELMVVISIIAVLAAMGVANFATAIKKSRDSVRKSELAELTQALMMFRADWGSYPNNDSASLLVLPLRTSTTELFYTGSDSVTHKLVPDYIRFMPIDEVRVGKSDDVQYTYRCAKLVPVTIGGTIYNRCVDFSVCAYLEVPQVSGANANADASSCTGSSCKWFCMYSP